MRPGLGSRLDSNFFAHDSTFSISDLVAAGQNANALDSGFPSGASTPAVHPGRDVSFSSFTATPVLERGDESEDGEEEDEDSDEEDDEEQDNEAMASSTSSIRKASSNNAFHLKPLLIQAVQELIDELESTRTNIARDSRDHIHSG